MNNKSIKEQNIDSENINENINENIEETIIDKSTNNVNQYINENLNNDIFIKNKNLEVSGLYTFNDTITSKGNIVPKNSCSASLGCEDFGWSDLFLSCTGVIYFGDNKETNLSHIPEKGLILNDDNQLQFGTSDTYINQSTEGNLNLVGDSISINGDTIDLTSDIINFNVNKEGILINSNQAKITIGNINSSNSMLLLNDINQNFRISINSITNELELGTGNKNGESTAISIDKNNNVKILSNSNSFSTSTGSLVVSGGMGISENLNIGGNIIVSESTSIGTQNNKSAINISDKGYVNIDYLSLKGENISASANDINQIHEIEPGIALPNKAVVLDDNNSIKGITTIEAKKIISTDKSIFNQLTVSDIILNDRSIAINKIASIEADDDGSLHISTLNSKYLEANINIKSKCNNTLSGKEINLISSKNINLNSNDVITMNTNKSEILLTDKNIAFAKFINNNGHLQINSGINNLPMINCRDDGLDIEGNLSFTTSLTCDKTVLLESDIKKLNNIENGIGKPNKALILDFNKTISNIALLKCKSIKSSGFSLFNRVTIKNVQIYEKTIYIKGDNKNYSMIYNDDKDNLNLDNYNEIEKSNININSNNSINLNSTSDIILNTVDSEIKLTNNGNIFGSFISNNDNLLIKSGTNSVIRFSETNAKFYGKIECDSINSKGNSTFDKINVGYIKINDRSISFSKSYNNYISLAVDTQGQLNISNTNNKITNANINIIAEGLIQLKSKDNITFDTLNGDIIFKSNDKTLVKFVNDDNKLVLKSDSINYATFTDSNLKIEGSLDCDKITSTGISSFEALIVEDTINFNSNNFAINCNSNSILLNKHEKTFASFNNNEGKLIISSDSTSINFNQNSLSINNSLELVNYLSVDNEILVKEDIVKLNKITSGIAQPNKILVLDNLKNISGIGSIKCNNIESSGNISIYNIDNPCLKVGTTNTESLTIEVIKGKSYRTAEEIRFSSHTKSTNAEHGKFTFVIDEIQKLEIDDFGLTISDGNLIIQESSTIGNVDNTSAIKINSNGSLTLNSKSNNINESLTLTSICNTKEEICNGSSIGFNIETPTCNNKGMILETILTNKNKQSFDYILKLMEDGTEAKEKLRVSSSGHLTFGNNEDIATYSQFVKNKYIGQLQGEYVTTLQIDIKDGISTNKVGKIIELDESDEKCLFKLNSSYNGFIYKVEMMCIEKPDGGNCNIQLYASTTCIDSRYESKDLSVDTEKNIKLIDTNGNWNVGRRKVSSEELTITEGLTDYYLYLVNGDNSKSGKYISGKFIIKLYGANF